MNIAVNTRLLLSGKLEGIGRFAHESLKRITAEHPEHTFIFIFDRNYSDEFVYGGNVIPVSVMPQARHPVLWYLWFERAVPRIARKYRADLFLSPDGYLPMRKNIRSVAVIHDINFVHYPQDMPFLFRKYLLRFFPRFAEIATRIATVSEFSKKDICSNYMVSAEKVDVVYNGVSDSFFPVPDAVCQKTRTRYTGGRPYFVAVGALNPRKNIEMLLKAFDLFKKGDDQDIRLVIAGEKMFWTRTMEEAYDNMKHKDKVVFTGRLSEKDLSEVLASSLALTYVSYFEGFGIPLIEAMACQVPVITSDVTSMPEVAGDAALTVNPFSADSICDGMKKMAGDKSIRDDLVEKGSRRVKDFSWDKTASLLWNCIEKASVS